jgi:hypothetical protein
LGLEFGAISATAAGSQVELVVGVHVSTIFYVDTMLLDWRRYCQMGWPDAYDQAYCSFRSWRLLSLAQLGLAYE